MEYIKPKILLVDDLKSNLFALMALLDEVDAELYQANSGKEALKMALEHEFALILLDVQMPDMDGFEVATYLRSYDKTRHVPIIFNTAIHHTEAYRHKGYDVGAVDYIEKPIDKKVLLSKIHVFLQLYDQKQQISLEKYKTEITLSAIPDPVITVQDGKIIYMNKAARSLADAFGHGDKCSSLENLFEFSEENLSKIQGLVYQVTHTGIDDSPIIELAFESPASSSHYVYEFRVVPIVGMRNKQEEVILMFHDISNLRSLSKELAFQAFHDPLTNCFNRRSFEEDFEHASARNARSKDHLAIMLIDLDNFKQINDTGGHNVGDKALCMTVERLNACLRDVDTLYRLGGDEFGVLIEDVADISSLKLPAQRMIKELSKTFEINKDTYQLGASIGITSTMIEEGRDSVGMLADADLAMYAAKNSGKNKFVFFEPKMRVNLNKKLRLDKELINAISDSEFCLFYQPQVNVKTNTLCGMEALIRWNHPDKGLVSPVEFITVLETTGLIKSVGRWVIEETCNQMYKWKQLGLDVPCVSVNVSPRQFEEKDLPDFVAQTLERYQLPAELLGIEITETLFMESSMRVENNLHALHKMGCKISLDDFGTGYSALSYLLRFPIDVIKIDQAFVKNITVHPEYQDMVTAIIHMAHGFSNMQVISEGVETASVLSVLGDLGCDIYQGYLFSKPVPASEIQKKMLLLT